MKIENSDYRSIYTLRDAFRRAGGTNDTLTNEFNRTDTPSTTYFRIFFYFHNGRLLDLDRNEDTELQNAHNLQSSTINKNTSTVDIKDTAYNFLLLNNEFERAGILEDFVHLLSNINTHSPWYFQKISGLDEALKRPEAGTDYKIPEESQSIAITCLPDAYDTRIGTLLDSYRAACFSHRLHKEIVPANLRKFDMVIYTFNTPIANMHRSNSTFIHDNSDRSIDRLKSEGVYRTSSKMYEFRDCEFSVNSSTSGLSDLDNAEGKQFEYQITINFNSVVEQRYNEFLARYIGDLIAWDIDYQLDSNKEREAYMSDSEGQYNTELKKNADYRVELYNSKSIHQNPDDAPGIGKNGTTLLDDVLKRVGFDNNMSKLSYAMQDVIDKYDPITNGIRAVNVVTGGISSRINQGISNLLLGNLFEDTRSLKSRVTEMGNRIINGKKDERTDPGSSIGSNLYHGWNKVSR